MNPIRSLQGIILEANDFEISENCDEIKKIQNRFLYLMRREISKKSKERMNECFIKDISKGTHIVEWSGLKFSLNPIQYEIYLKTRKSLEARDDLSQIILNKEYKRKNPTKKATALEFNKLYALDKKLAQHKSILSTILRIQIYLDLNMIGKVENLINAILQEEYIVDFFEIEPNDKNKNNVDNAVIEILENIDSIYDDKELVKTLVAYLSFGIESQMRRSLNERFDLPNRLSYVQEKIKSYNYGVKFPFAWTAWIEKFSSTVELEKYLNRTEFYDNLAQKKYSYLALLRSYFPLDEHKRLKILNAYQALGEEKNNYLVDLKFRMHENEDFLKYLIKEKLSDKALFVEKRKFYKSLLEKNQTMAYSLFNLLKLGDFDEEYFIKFLAMKTYGL